jgi:hypothetical protein
MSVKTSAPDDHPFNRPDVLKRHLAILGKSGSGKTYAAKGAVERLLAGGQQVVILDPTSAWWGLRLAQDGKTPLNEHLVIIGGRHGDVPLAGTPEQGAAIAELVCREGLSCVLDTGDLTVGERTRWALKFAETLYRRVQRPLHLVIDEAHEFAPQGSNPSPEAAQMVHAFKQLASGGRSRGVRLMLITQRPAKLHKDVLTTAETLVAMRVLAPQDREAIKEWVEGCGDPKRAREVLDSLAQLKVGEGWYWCPELEIGPVRLGSLPIRTYDSSATPEDGQARQVELGQVDRERIGRLLAAAGEQIAADDPRQLRARIKQLEAQLDGRTDAAQRDPQELQEIKDRLERQIAEYGKLCSHVKGILKSLAQTATEAFDSSRLRLDYCHERIIKQLDIVHEQVVSQFERPTQQQPAPPIFSDASSDVVLADLERPFYPKAPGGATLTKAQRSILTALAQARRALPRASLAVRAGYSAGGGGFRNALSECRVAGWVGGDDLVEITPKGIEALGKYEPLPTGKALREWWLQHGGLGKAEREVLSVLGVAHELAVRELAQRAGYGASGGGFRNALSRLRTLQLISGSKRVRIAQELL